MSCRVQRNREGKITNILTEGGQSSEVFRKIYSIPFTGSTEVVYKTMTNIYSDRVEEMFQGVTDSRFVYENTTEPRIFLKDSKGNLTESVESAIIANNTGMFEVGILNPSNSEFVAISRFNTDASVISKGITDGIATGTVSPERIITKDGNLRFKGKGIYEQDIKATSRVFKQDFESATGIYVRVFTDGTLEVKDVSNFVTVNTKNGGSRVMSKQEALKETETNNSITNKAEIVVASMPELLSTPYRRVEDLGSNISERGYLKMLTSFSKSLGFTTVMLDEYTKSFNNRHGSDPDVSALVDLNNRVVAISEGGNVIDNMTEEVAHLAVEAYSDQNSILGALVDIDQTQEYAQFASIYRNKYASQFEGNEIGLEDAVRKEILGKVIARNVKEAQFQNSEVQTVWQRFVDFIRSVFKPSYRKTIDRLTNDIKNALETGNTSNFGNQIESDGVFYSLSKLSDDVVESIKGTTKIINSLATLSERSDGRGVRTKISERNIPRMMGQNELISAIKDITDTIETNLKELSIKVNNNNLSSIDRTRAETFKAIVDNNLSQYYTLLEDVDTDSLQPAKKALSEKIGILSTEATKMANRFRKVDDELFDQMLEEVAIRHNMDETSKEEMKSLFKGTLKDISRLNSTFGLTSESSNPYLSLMATIISDLKTSTARKSQQKVNEVLELAEKNKWDNAKTQSDLLEYDEDGKATGYVETGLDQGKLDREENKYLLELISRVKGVDEKEAQKLYGTKNTDDIFESEEDKKTFKDWEKAFREENIVDRSLQEDILEREEMNKVAGVSEGYIESVREDKRTINSIRNDAKYILETGEIDAGLMTEEDRFIMDSEMSRLKSKASPLDQNLQIRYGLKLKKVSDLTEEEKASLPYYEDASMKEHFDKALSNPNRTIILPTINTEELPFESRFTLDHFNINFARQIKFSERPESKASDNYVDALKQLEEEGDFAGAFEFAKENGSIVFTDAYYDQLGGGEYYIEVVESSLESMDEEDATIVRDLLDDLKELTSRRSEFLRSYRSTRDITQINAEHISFPERQAFKKLEEDIPATKRDINKRLKKYGVELPNFEYSTESILNVNNAFEIELANSGMEELDFALNEMSENNAEDTRNFKAHVKQSLRSNPQSNKRYDEFLSNLRGAPLYNKIIGLETEEEVIEGLTFEYAKTRIPAYFKSQIPVEWLETESRITNGQIRLSELVQNNQSISNLVTIQPNYSWSDLSYNRGKVNPEYKKSFGNRQPKMAKYKNQGWFEKYGVTEQEWQEAEDITQLEARNNQNQFEYNKAMISLRKESDKRYKYEGNIYLAPQLSTTGWQKLKSATKAGGVKSALKDSLRDVIIDRVDELDYGETLDGTISGIEAVKIPPTYHRKKLDDANSLSRDTLGSYLLDVVKSNEYESRVEMSGRARALINKASESRFSDASMLKSKKRIVKEGQTSEVVKKLKDTEDYHFYGIKQSRRMEVDFMGKKLDLTRVITNFRKLSVFTNLAVNPLVATTSFTTGVVNNVIDRMSGGVYSSLAQNQTNKILLQDSTKFIGQDGKLTVNSRLNTLMETFGMKNIEQRFNESASSRLSRIFTESAFKLDELANLAVVPRVLYSTLFDHRLVISKDNDGKDIYRILDFNQFKVHARNNGMTTKSEINSAWAKTKAFFDLLDTSDAVTTPTEKYLKYFTHEEFNNHVNTISIKAIQQNQRVDGMISDIDKTPAQRDVFLNLLMQHKAWFPIIMSQQFKNSGFNFSRGRFEEGYVRTGGDFLLNLAKNWRNPTSYYKEWMESANDQQKANLKRALAMAGVLGSLIALSLAFASSDDDDDSALEDFARIITYRTTSEVQSASLMGFYSTSKSVLESPVTALSTFDDQFKLLKALGSVNSDKYKEELWEKFVKVTPFKRISQMNDLEGTTSKWLFFNRDEMWYLNKDKK